MIARYVAAGLFTCLLSFSASAQRSLESLVADANADWMFGTWQAETDNGDTVTLKVSWDLDKHVVVLNVKTPDMEAKGYTVIEPKEEQPKYYGFDNHGVVSKGSWNVENGDLVLRLNSEIPDRAAEKAGFVFTGSASTGLQVRMHSVDSSGDLATPPRVTLKFKQQKKDTGAKK